MTGLLEKEKERRNRLKELEISYDYPGYAALVGSAKPAPKTKQPAAKAEKVVKKEVKKESAPKDKKKPTTKKNSK